MALMPNYGISLSNDPYDWVHSRTVYNNWGSGNVISTSQKTTLETALPITTIEGLD